MRSSVSTSSLFIFYAPDRREGGNKRCFCPFVCPSVRPSVCLSVCLSVGYIASKLHLRRIQIIFYVVWINISLAILSEIFIQIGYFF